VASHVKKFAPANDAFYIKEVETKAWCKPVYDGSNLSSEQHLFLLRHSLTRVEWDETFKIFAENQMPEWIKTASGEKLWAVITPGEAQVQSASLADKREVVQLISPKFATPDTGLFQLIPTMSYDSVELETNVSEEMDQVIHAVNDRFQKMKAKWSTAFGEIEAGYLVVINDSKQLQSHLSIVMTTLGSSDGSNPGTTVLQQLRDLTSTLTASTGDLQAYMLMTADNLNKVSAQCDDLHTSMQFFENEALLNQTATTDRLAMVEKQLSSYEGRFARLLPLLQNITKQSTAFPSQDALLCEEFQEMQRRMDLFSAQVTQKSVLGTEDLSSQVISLQAQVKLLQQQIFGDGVQIGSKVFQSFDDLHAWVPLKLPNRRYGLFVDAVSLLDFFTSVGHVDPKQTFTSFYSQKRTGFASMYEARVAASVKNLFPMVFRKSESSGLDTSDKLPALSDPDKWDNGATGLKYQNSAQYERCGIPDRICN